MAPCCCAPPSNSWFPPSRYSIGTFDGMRYSALSQAQGILGGDSDYVPKSGADESNRGRRFLCAHHPKRRQQPHSPTLHRFLRSLWQRTSLPALRG